MLVLLVDSDTVKAKMAQYPHDVANPKTHGIQAYNIQQQPRACGKINAEYEV